MQDKQTWKLRQSLLKPSGNLFSRYLIKQAWKLRKSLLKHSGNLFQGISLASFGRCLVQETLVLFHLCLHILHFGCRFQANFFELFKVLTLFQEGCLQVTDFIFQTNEQIVSILLGSLGPKLCDLHLFDEELQPLGSLAAKISHFCIS